ncbi:MAG: methionyl-tRNA formyltransferase, partial [Chlamydiia bacterium]|nr:methionyl-tRNA formyltransferase [Chlamydiia bacterium]
MRIVFLGTSSFAAYILKDLLTNRQEQVVAIITRPDRPQGRKLQISHSPVKESALAICPEIPLMQPEKA